MLPFCRPSGNGEIHIEERMATTYGGGTSQETSQLRSCISALTDCINLILSRPLATWRAADDALSEAYALRGRASATLVFPSGQHHSFRVRLQSPYGSLPHHNQRRHSVSSHENRQAQCTRSLHATARYLSSLCFPSG